MFYRPEFILLLLWRISTSFTSHFCFLQLMNQKFYTRWEWGMGIVVSSSCVVSASPSSSGGGLLTLFPCFSVWSFPQGTVLHKLLQNKSFPRTSPSWTVPLWVPFRGFSPSGTDWFSMALLWVHMSCQQKCSTSWAPVSILPKAYYSADFPWVIASFGHSPAPLDPLWAAEGQPASPWSSAWAAGETLCSSVWNTSSIFLGVCRAVSLMHSHPPLSLCTAPKQIFSPFLNTFKKHYLWRRDSALDSDRTILELAGTSSFSQKLHSSSNGNRESYYSHPCSPSHLRLQYQNLANQTVQEEQEYSLLHVQWAHPPLQEAHSTVWPPLCD